MTLNLRTILLLVKLALLVLRYGPKLVKFFLDRHDKVEAEAKLASMTSDDKAKLFNRGAANDIIHVQQRAVHRGELNHIREQVWQANNPGKQPKKLTDPRLRVFGKFAGS